jgi:pimeloyl-ACP methyl ester carboxylesterase
MSPADFEARQRIPAQQRIAEWIERLRNLSSRTARKYPTLEDAVQRMRDENPRLSAAQAHHLTLHGVNQNEDGTFSWKFDNYIRAWAPYGFSAAEIVDLWSRIACPTLLVHGADSWLSAPDKNGALGAFANAKSVTFPGAGHWVHHDKLEEFVDAAGRFLKS